MKLYLKTIQGLPGQSATTLHVAGDVLTIDGTPNDLSAVPEGGRGWPEDGSPIAGPITRVDGVLHVSVRVRLGDDAAQMQPTDPAHWIIDAEGDVAIPALQKPVPVPEEDPDATDD